MNSIPANHVADEGVVPTARHACRTVLPDTGHEKEADDRHKIRLLVFTSLYPNAAQPRHGVFVEERLRHLVGSGRIAATVVAPVPWFPFRHERFGTYAAFARVPRHEHRHGIRVLHPRYPVVPKVGMNVAPFLMYRALLPGLRKWVADGNDFDLIDAHYFYPDGVAAVRVGVALGKPVVITARGTDVNVISHYRQPGRQIRRAADHAAAIVTVSQSLKEKVQALGVDSGRITTLRNGVDLDRFGPRDRDAIRARWGLQGPVWLTVSHLVERKGVHIVVEALAQAPDCTLMIAGDGPERRKLRDLAARLGVQARVQFLGAVEHADLCEYYNAADVMFLASDSEGMPNVVLESMACGTPVVATPFDGVAELVSVPDAGEVAHERNVEGVIHAWQALRARAPERAATRKFAESLGWPPVVEAQNALYARVLIDTGELKRRAKPWGAES